MPFVRREKKGKKASRDETRTHRGGLRRLRRFRLSLGLGLGLGLVGLERLGAGSLRLGPRRFLLSRLHHFGREACERARR